MKIHYNKPSIFLVKRTKPKLYFNNNQPISDLMKSYLVLRFLFSPKSVLRKYRKSTPRKDNELK